MTGDTPRSSRPTFPDGYGLPTSRDGVLPWSEVERELAGARVYWMATVRPNGRPHVIPRWGVWVDGRFWYDGSPDTVHARNLRANPECALHLESGDRVVIVEGRSEAIRADADPLGARLSEAFGKYRADGYSPGADAWADESGGGLCVLTPSRALAWFRFPSDATRFRFGKGQPG